MLEEKLDALIAAMNKNTERLGEVLAAGQGGVVAAAAADKPKAAAKKKDEPAKPATDMATLKAKFEELKAVGQAPALKKIIGDAGFTSLAELLNVPAKYDETFGKLTDLEASLAPVAEEDDL